MDTNQILLIAIVVLLSLVVVVALYFLILFLINKKRKKKVDNIFNPSHLVEEESLMNVLDEKRNVEYKEQGNDQERFVKSNDDVKIVTSEELSREDKINPFGVDMTMHTKDNAPIEIPDSTKTNKFIK